MPKLQNNWPDFFFKKCQYHERPKNMQGKTTRNLFRLKETKETVVYDPIYVVYDPSLDTGFWEKLRTF